jgi:hypothetical protein
MTRGIDQHVFVVKGKKNETEMFDNNLCLWKTTSKVVSMSRGKVYAPFQRCNPFFKKVSLINVTNAC